MAALPVFQWVVSELKFSLKSPAMFAFAGSISGAGCSRLEEEDLSNLKSIRDSAVAAFGPQGSETRKANDIFEIIRGVSPGSAADCRSIYLDCGTEDFRGRQQPVCALLREKRSLTSFVNCRAICGAYWDQQVREVLRIAAENPRQ
jgi:S-formylglutathione hydrolase FrmB